MPLGEDALPNGLDVTFEVTELRRMTGSYNTMVGNNEGSMVSATMHGVSIYFLRGHTVLDPIMVLRWPFFKVSFKVFVFALTQISPIVITGTGPEVT